MKRTTPFTIFATHTKHEPYNYSELEANFATHFIRTNLRVPKFFLWELILRRISDMGDIIVPSLRNEFLQRSQGWKVPLVFL